MNSKKIREQQKKIALNAENRDSKRQIQPTFSIKDAPKIISPNLIQKMFRQKKSYEEECRRIEVDTEIENFENRRLHGNDAIVKPIVLPPRPLLNYDLLRDLESPHTKKLRYEESPNIFPKMADISPDINSMHHGCPCCTPDLYSRPRSYSRILNFPNNERTKTRFVYHQRNAESALDQPTEPILTEEEKEERNREMMSRLSQTMVELRKRPLTRREITAMHDLELFETRHKKVKLSNQNH